MSSFIIDLSASDFLDILLGCLVQEMAENGKNVHHSIPEPKVTSLV